MTMLSLGLGLVPTISADFSATADVACQADQLPAHPGGEAGVNAHHDAGFLTILLQHEVGGLQVENASGEWIDVPPASMRSSSTSARCCRR